MGLWCPTTMLCCGREPDCPEGPMVSSVTLPRGSPNEKWTVFQGTSINVVVFHSGDTHDTPVWMVYSGKSHRSKWMITRGTPSHQETSIWDLPMLPLITGEYTKKVSHRIPRFSREDLSRENSVLAVSFPWRRVRRKISSVQSDSCGCFSWVSWACAQDDREASWDTLYVFQYIICISMYPRLRKRRRFRLRMMTDSASSDPEKLAAHPTLRLRVTKRGCHRTVDRTSGTNYFGGSCSPSHPYLSQLRHLFHVCFFGRPGPPWECCNWCTF